MRRTFPYGAWLVLAFFVQPRVWAGTNASAVDDRLLDDVANGSDWAAYGRTFDESHYSPLTQINESNVTRLGLEWFYDLPPMASVYTAPLAIDGVLYFAVGYSKVYAMKARTGQLLWQYDPQVTARAGMKLRGSWGIRGIAAWKGNLYVGTHDGRLIALNAQSGRPVWSVSTVEGPNDGRYITGAPRTFNGKVIIGFGGADYAPVRGYVTAYDAETGKQLWRFYTVPGNPKDGFENNAMEIAAKTWTGEWWKFGGGGTVWNAITYDPKFNTIYLGTGNGSPWNHRIRSPRGGDNLFLSSVVALDADTGAYRWHHQMNPGESWDYNAAMDMQLTTLSLNGRQHDVLMTAPKDGFFYVIDRATGKLLSAQKWAQYVNWAERVDLVSGRPVENPAARFPGGSGFWMFPGGGLGAHSTQPMAYSPQTRLVYIPETSHVQYYSDRGVDRAKWKFGSTFEVGTGLSSAAADPPKEPLPKAQGALVAWDPEHARRAWTIPMKALVNGGVTATAGNLVIQGRADGDFVIYAADTGKELWRFFAQNGILGQPITYLAGAKQYITVIVGYGGVAGATASGASGRTEPLWEYRSQKRRVLTFALQGQAQLPKFEPYRKAYLDDRSFQVDAAKEAAGANLYGRQCPLCHGFGLNSGGTAPDLRESHFPMQFDALKAILHDGALEPNGMPKFAEFTDEQIESLQHYVRAEARRAIEAQRPSR